MNVETPLGNQSPPKHVIQCKECGNTPKNVFYRAWQKKYKKERKKKPIFKHYISPLCPADPAGSICTIFGTLDQIADVIIQVKF